jgi:hypothetical protein
VRYRILYKNALQPGAWSTLVEVTGDGSAINYTDASSTTVTTRFYQVEVLP